MSDGNAGRAAGIIPWNRRKGFAGVLYEFWKNKTLYAMFLPACVLLFLFNYLPLFGLTLVFKNFDFGKGIFGSPLQTPWYGNFIFLFKNEGTFRAIRNTLINNLSFMVFNTVAAILLAILLNEIFHRRLKQVAQSMTLLPYFISTVVISVFVYQVFNTNNGMINGILSSFGMEPVGWYETPGYWRVILTIIYVWKNSGYMAVIYLATITGIDNTLFEAAEIDGAKRFQRIIYITLPLLIPTVITMSLLAVGRILNSDFTFYYAIVGDNALLYKTTDVLDTFIFRNLRTLGDFTMSGAASFIQSILSGVILVVCNMFARRYDENAALF
ncbi:MAG: ABC transporter permease subunit [Clostridiales bacterium]|jgi:putative aldouronate transport system permease protein|nr:ABC transporter permease subunit [Clostridiales bacterium]